MAEFNLIKSNIEITYAKRGNIVAGCTLNQDDLEVETVKSFDSKKEAIQELQKYKTEIRELSGSAGKYFSVIEYYVEDDDGNIWEFSKMEITVTGKQSYNTEDVFSSYAEAEQALDALDDGFISFN